VALYEAHRAALVRIARDICGAEAEDVVQDVALYLLRRCANVRFGRAYFYQAVRITALRRRLYGWAKYEVAMDPEMLELVEEAMARRTRLWSFRNLE
jgi:hypothetical protein